MDGDGHDDPDGDLDENDEGEAGTPTENAGDNIMLSTSPEAESLGSLIDVDDETRYFVDEAVANTSASFAHWVEQALHASQHSDSSQAQGSKINTTAALSILSNGLESLPHSADLWLVYLHYYQRANRDDLRAVREMIGKALSQCPDSYDLRVEFVGMNSSYIDRTQLLEESCTHFNSSLRSAALRACYVRLIVAHFESGHEAKALDLLRQSVNTASLCLSSTSIPLTQLNMSDQITFALSTTMPLLLSSSLSHVVRHFMCVERPFWVDAPADSLHLCYPSIDQFWRQLMQLPQADEAATRELIGQSLAQTLLRCCDPPLDPARTHAFMVLFAHCVCFERTAGATLITDEEARGQVTRMLVECWEDETAFSWFVPLAHPARHSDMLDLALSWMPKLESCSVETHIVRTYQSMCASQPDAIDTSSLDDLAERVGRGDGHAVLKHICAFERVDGMPDELFSHCRNNVFAWACLLISCHGRDELSFDKVLSAGMDSFGEFWQMEILWGSAIRARPSREKLARLVDCFTTDILHHVTHQEALYSRLRYRSGYGDSMLTSFSFPRLQRFYHVFNRVVLDYIEMFSNMEHRAFICRNLSSSLDSNFELRLSHASLEMALRDYFNTKKALRGLAHLFPSIPHLWSILARMEMSRGNAHGTIRIMDDAINHNYLSARLFREFIVYLRIMNDQDTLSIVMKHANDSAINWK